MVQRQTWVEGEPSLEELLSDPIVDCLMRRDGLSREDVRRAVEAARLALIRAERRTSAAA